jgi:hypothetical protein
VGDDEVAEMPEPGARKTLDEDIHKRQKRDGSGHQQGLLIWKVDVSCQESRLTALLLSTAFCPEKSPKAQIALATRKPIFVWIALGPLALLLTPFGVFPILREIVARDSKAVDRDLSRRRHQELSNLLLRPEALSEEEFQEVTALLRQWPLEEQRRFIQLLRALANTRPQIRRLVRRMEIELHV